MKYKYEAVNRDGEVFSGIIEAAGEREALRMLGSQGASPLSLVPAREEAQGKGGRLRDRDVNQALDEFCTLLESGIGIAEAVGALVQADYHGDIRAFFEHVSKSLQSGDSVSAAFNSAALVLPSVVLQLVETGEATGELPACLRESVNQLQYAQQVRGEFRAAMTYPAILMASGVAAIGLIFVFVVPKFANLVQNNKDMPWLGSVVINGGMWFNSNWYLVLGTLFAVGAALVIQARDAAFRARALDFFANFPVIGAWLVERDVGNWSSSMAALLNNRVELVVALGLARGSVQLAARRQRLDRVEQAVKSGESLSAALEENRVLSSTAYNLIRVGEKSGRLPHMMRSVATICEQNRKNRTAQVLALIEPIAILVIGVVIGVLIMGVILAITSVNDVAL
jgi:general secretion pathway protein F